MDEGASAIFVAEKTSVVNYRGFPRQLTAAGLTTEGHFGHLHVFFSPLTCVNNNFQAIFAFLGSLNNWYI